MIGGGDSDTRSGTKGLYRNFYVLQDTQDRTIALFRCRHTLKLKNPARGQIKVVFNYPLHSECVATVGLSTMNQCIFNGMQLKE